MKVIIIDDEPLARELIKEYLQSYAALQIVQECNDGFEGFKAIQQHQPDLIFLDVQMPKINGFEMLELVEQPPAIIFTTAFDEYAIKAFEAHAVDYLLKPFSKERFDKAVGKFLQTGNTKAVTNDLLTEVTPRVLGAEEQQRIVVKSGNNIKILPSHEIIYIEAYDDYVKIFTNSDVYLKKKTLSYYETVLARDFLRVHRSYLIPLAQITRIEVFEKNSHVAILKNGNKIPLSRNGYAALKEKLGV